VKKQQSDTDSNRTRPGGAAKGKVETALAGWQRQHTDLTTRLIAIETDIDDRVTRLFNLTDADRLLLADHSLHAMIDYPYGAV